MAQDVHIEPAVMSTAEYSITRFHTWTTCPNWHIEAWTKWLPFCWRHAFSWMEMFGFPVNFIDMCGQCPQVDKRRDFDVFFDVCLNKLMKKHSSRQWSETSWRSRDVTIMAYGYTRGTTQVGSLPTIWYQSQRTHDAIITHEKINGHRELTVSSRWAHGGHGSGAQWSRLSHG